MKKTIITLFLVLCGSNIVFAQSDLNIETMILNGKEKIEEAVDAWQLDDLGEPAAIVLALHFDVHRALLSLTTRSRTRS